MHGPVHQHHRGALPERLPTSRRDQHRAQREHVGGAADVETLSLLGSQEAGCAEGRAGRGQPGRLQGPCDTEIEHARTVVGHDDVARLEVTVDKAAVMDGLQRLRQRRAEQPQSGLVHWPPFGEQPRQRRPRDVGGRQPGSRCVWISVDDLRRMEPADPACGVDLSTEPGAEVRIGGQLGSGHLDGHGTSAPGPCQVHRPHAARPQLTLHGVVADALRQVHAVHAPPPVPHFPVGIPRVSMTARSTVRHARILTSTAPCPGKLTQRSVDPRCVGRVRRSANVPLCYERQAQARFGAL